MKARIGMAALAVALAGIALTGAAQEAGKRSITFLEDRDQDYMVTKVYEIKNMKAADLRPFVEGAVRRADAESSVSRLNFGAANRQLLQVNMPNWMVPYIDDMVAKLDRPGDKDAEGAVIAGTGAYRFSYMPQYRSSAAMLVPIAGRFGGGDDIQYRDAASNLFYWKGSYSDGMDVAKWVQALDRPVPQMEVTLNVYEINDGDLMELGIDYVAWKNGPGAEIFSTGMDFLDSKSFSDSSTQYNPLDIANYASHSWGGFLVAPNIDATFVRMLAQKGKAKVATTGSLTVVNDWNNAADALGNVSNPGAFATARYRLQLDPQYQRITKDANQQITVAASAATPRINFYLRDPVINFNPEADKDLAPWAASQGAQVNFGWVLHIRDTIVEQANDGNDVANDFDFRSHMTLAAGTEKLLATYTKTHDTEQDNGVIGLSEIPGLNYLFGSEMKSKTTTRVIITVSASPVVPAADLAPWAGRIIADADEILKK